jgi:hypothetical protein
MGTPVLRVECLIFETEEIHRGVAPYCHRQVGSMPLDPTGRHSIRALEKNTADQDGVPAMIGYLNGYLVRTGRLAVRLDIPMDEGPHLYASLLCPPPCEHLPADRRGSYYRRIQGLSASSTGGHSSTLAQPSEQQPLDASLDIGHGSGRRHPHRWRLARPCCIRVADMPAPPRPE